MIIIVLINRLVATMESQKAGKPGKPESWKAGKHEINGRADHKKERLLYIATIGIYNIKKAVQHTGIPAYQHTIIHVLF